MTRSAARDGDEGEEAASERDEENVSLFREGDEGYEGRAHHHSGGNSGRPLRIPRAPRPTYEGDSTTMIGQIAEALASMAPQILVPNDPGPYEGGQDFPRWRKFVLRCQKTNSWSRDQLVCRMGQFLDGPAWLTFERMRDRDELPDDIGEMLDAVGRKHCDLQGAKRDAGYKFRMRRQRAGENIHQFLAAFEALASDCGASEDAKMRTFIENVCAEASDALTRLGADTWAELRSAAVREQHVMDNRRARVAQVANLRQRERDLEDEEYETALAAVNAVQQRQQPWFQRGPGYEGHRGQDTRSEYEPARARQGGAYQAERLPGVEQKLDQLVELMKQLLGGRVAQEQMQGGGQQGRRCYRCDEAGHFARECPKQGNGRGARVDVQPQAPPAP